jgi:DNA-binding GntR family transcriptional regulator
MQRKSAEHLRQKLAARSQNGSGKILLKDRAYQELKRLIQSNVFPPGTFLSERKLVEQLHMSKTPIRSALEQLETLGLVRVSPQQGIVVRELSVQEILDLFDLRLAIEPFLLGRLAERGLSTKQEERLQTNLEKQRKAAERADAITSTEVDIEFHLLLAEWFGNQEIVAVLRQALDKLFRSILRIWRAFPGRLNDSYQEHAGVLEALRREDSTQAVRRIEEHLRAGRNRQFQ